MSPAAALDASWTVEVAGMPLREQRVDRSKLNAGATAGIAKICGSDVVGPIGRQ